MAGAEGRAIHSGDTNPSVDSLDKHVESLSRLDPSLLIGNKDVDELKFMSLTGRNGVKQLAVRADQLNLSDLDAELTKILSRSRESTPSDVKEGSGGGTKSQVKAWEKDEPKLQPLVSFDLSKPQPWEIDVERLFIRDKIAQGTYGTVHRGTYNGQDVAVKLLDWGEDDTESRGRLYAIRKAFFQEVEVWSTLSHPNVCQFVGASVGKREGYNLQSITSKGTGSMTVSGHICCVVVEYISGGTLKEFLIEHYDTKLDMKTVLRLALGFARGLQYLHSKRIIHRDVKSENILLDKSNNIKIADFGVARVLPQSLKDITGNTGTIGYMAPEVLDSRPYNHKADVYSFGICLWEIYKCDMPYFNLSIAQMETIVKQNVRPDIPSVCPADLANVMRKCWDADPDKRPNMTEVVTMLEGVNPKGMALGPRSMLPKKNGGCGCM